MILVRGYIFTEGEGDEEYYKPLSGCMYMHRLLFGCCSSRKYHERGIRNGKESEQKLIWTKEFSCDDELYNHFNTVIYTDINMIMIDNYTIRYLISKKYEGKVWYKSPSTGSYDLFEVVERVRCFDKQGLL